MKIDTSAATTIFGDFKELYHTKVSPALYDRVVDYKSRIASKFKSIAKDYLPKLKGNEFYVSVKLDGEHSHLFYEGGEAYLIRPRGYVYFGLPCLDHARDVLRGAGVKRCLLPGELYVKKPEYQRTRVFDVITATKYPKSTADLESLSFAPFDILYLDEESFLDFGEILGRLQAIFGDSPLNPPPHVVTRKVEEIQQFYDRWVNRLGAEGLMIRTDLTFRYKLKAQHTIDAAIIGYTAENELVTSVLTALLTEDGHLQVLTGVEKGMTDVERMSLFQQLSELHAETDYLEVSKFSTPYFMVRPKIIIEFSCNDMIAERPNGSPIKKANLTLKKGKYRIVKSTPFASLKHSVFVRFRDDKAINPVDLRISQITDYIRIEDADKASQPIEFPATEIVLREVYVKTVKDKTSIRKFVVWRTSKQQVDDTAYTEYAFNYTDYSPNRKEPLKQDVRISNSKRQILAIAREFVEKNIKKGWERLTQA